MDFRFHELDGVKAKVNDILELSFLPGDWALMARRKRTMTIIASEAVGRQTST